MQRSKLIKLLSAFSQDDWIHFDRYLIKNHKPKSDLVQLYRYIRNKKNKLDSGQINIAEAQKAIAPKLSRKSFQNIMSRIVKEIMNFFVAQERERDDLDYQLRLLAAYDRRGLYKLYDKESESTKHSIINKEVKDIWDDYHLFYINQKQFFSENPIKYSNGKEILSDGAYHLSRFNNNMQAYHKSTQFHFGRITNNSLVETISKRLESKDKTPLKDWLGKFQDFNATRNLDTYQSLFHVFLKYNDVVDVELVYATLESLTNYVTLAIVTGQDIDPRDLLQLYLYGFDSKFYLQLNHLDGIRFLNFANVALTCDEFNLLDSYYNAMLGMLPKEDRVAIDTIYNATVSLYKHEYGKCLEYLRDLHTTRINLKLPQRICALLASCQYYSKNKYYLKDQFRNFEAFIKNNEAKISTKNIAGCLNLVRALKLLVNNDQEALSILLARPIIVKNRLWIKNLSKEMSA